MVSALDRNRLYLDGYAARLTALRERLGLNNLNFARLLGVNTRLVSACQRGRKALPLAVRVKVAEMEAEL